MPIIDRNASDDNDNTIIVIEDGQDLNGKRASIETKPNGKNGVHVIAEIQATDGSIPSVSSKLRYTDLNASVGGVARGTSITNAAWVDIYSYTGSGLIFSTVINLEDKNNWQIRLVVDGEEIFGSDGIFSTDLDNDASYNLDEAGSSLSPNEGNVGLSLEEKERIVWTCPSSFPVRYRTSFEIKIKRVAGQNAKKFNAGLLVSTRE